MILDGAGMKCDKFMKSFYSETSEYICPRVELASCSNSRRRKGGKLKRCKEAGMADLTELFLRVREKYFKHCIKTYCTLPLLIHSQLLAKSEPSSRTEPARSEEAKDFGSGLRISN
jgi:hypothetical protein